MARFVCRPVSLDVLNEDTRRLRLALPDGEVCHFKAGQYLEIFLPGGKACPFSIANPPSDSGIVELHIRPTPDSSDSVEIEALISSAIEIEIEIPKGECFINEVPERELLLIAASTGITQMKSIVEFLLTRGLGHRVHLYWGVLRSTDLYLSEQCQGWERQNPLFRYVPVVSEPEKDPAWQGRTGLVGEVALQDFERLDQIQVVVSGSPAMVYTTLDAFVTKGMPAGNMQSDVFSYAPRQ